MLEVIPALSDPVVVDAMAEYDLYQSCAEPIARCLEMCLDTVYMPSLFECFVKVYAALAAHPNHRAGEFFRPLFDFILHQTSRRTADSVLERQCECLGGSELKTIWLEVLQDRIVQGSYHSALTPLSVLCQLRLPSGP